MAQEEPLATVRFQQAASGQKGQRRDHPPAVRRDELAARQDDADLHGPVSPRDLGLVRRSPRG